MPAPDRAGRHARRPAAIGCGAAHPGLAARSSVRPAAGRSRAQASPAVEVVQRGEVRVGRGQLAFGHREQPGAVVADCPIPRGRIVERVAVDGGLGEPGEELPDTGDVGTDGVGVKRSARPRHLGGVLGERPGKLLGQQSCSSAWSAASTRSGDLATTDRSIGSGFGALLFRCRRSIGSHSRILLLILSSIRTRIRRASQPGPWPVSSSHAPLAMAGECSRRGVPVRSTC
jgi:hypothetical protein